MAKILFGEFKICSILSILNILEFLIYFSIAILLALGKDRPKFNCSFKSFLNSRGSFTKISAIFFNVVTSPHSEPKHMLSTIFKLFRVEIAPKAKYSAEIQNILSEALKPNQRLLREPSWF